MSWLSKLKQGLSKTAAFFTAPHLKNLDEVEVALLTADVGYQTTSEIMEVVRQQKPKTEDAFRLIIHTVLQAKITPIAKPLTLDTSHKPFIILMIGVNGAGKTTTIGKLGAIYQKKGFKVSFVAADTFRAGATEQLCRWGEKLGVTTHTASAGADADSQSQEYPCEIINQEPYRDHRHGQHLVYLISHYVNQLIIYQICDSQCDRR